MFCFRDSLLDVEGYKLAWSVLVCTETSLEMTKYYYYITNKFCSYSLLLLFIILLTIIQAFKTLTRNALKIDYLSVETSSL